MRGVPIRVLFTGGCMAVFFTFLLVRWCPFLRAQIVSTFLPKYPCIGLGGVSPVESCNE